MPQKFLLNYPDTLLQRWKVDISKLLEPNASKQVEEYLGTSDGRSRCSEYFRLGFINKKLQRGKVGESTGSLAHTITKLGYLMAVIYRGRKLPGFTKLPELTYESAVAAFCALICLVIHVQVGGKSWSVNYVLHKLLEFFPVQAGYDKYLWCRYILSAFVSELDKGDHTKELAEFLSSNVGNCPELGIESCKAPYEVRCKFNSSASVAAAIKDRVSLTGIRQQKFPLFMLDATQGLFSKADRIFNQFLEESYLFEMKEGKNLFSSLYGEDETTSKKGSILETLSEIFKKSESPKLKNDFRSVMNTIIQGAQAAIDLLGGSETAVHTPKNGRNVIYFGPPGTGKSTAIDKAIMHLPGAKTTRVTFHPDTDYASFVGCYKPSSDMAKDKIVYRFRPQAFTNVYVDAWKNKDVPHVLVIEELNRGNCAQTFGDIFQLLDRDDKGESRFPIAPDNDLKEYLAKEFETTDELETRIKEGEEMRLPENLYIWATINTSDQSLFPIDSAFKRRWDWRYVPIINAKKDFYVSLGGKSYDWWDFLEKINIIIANATSSEDKQMGYWFARPSNGGKEITAEDFLYKVLAYLWMDVFKEIDEGSPFIFKDSTRTTFKDYSTEEGTPNERLLVRFLSELGVAGKDIPETGEAEENGRQPELAGTGVSASAEVSEPQP